MSWRAVGSVLVAVALAACGDGSPTSPDNLPGLAVQSESPAYTYRAAPGDTIDTAWQQAYHDWAVAELEVTITRRIIYHKYLSRQPMGQHTGTYNTNGFATPARTRRPAHSCAG